LFRIHANYADMECLILSGERSNWPLWHLQKSKILT